MASLSFQLESSLNQLKDVFITEKRGVSTDGEEEVLPAGAMLDQDERWTADVLLFITDNWGHGGWG